MPATRPRCWPRPPGCGTRGKGGPSPTRARCSFRSPPCATTRCTYCTFAKPPGAGGQYLEPDEVMADRPGRRGARLHRGAVHPRRPARGALARSTPSSWPSHGHTTTLDYVQEMTERVAGRDHAVPACQPRAHSRRCPGRPPAVQPVDGDDAGEHLAPVSWSRACPTTAPRTRSPGCGWRPSRAPAGSGSRSPPGSSSASARNPAR